MAVLFIQDPLTGTRPITLGFELGSGLNGTVYRLVGETGTVVKLYKEASQLPEYQDKVAAMLASPPNLSPVSSNNRLFVQIAWPSATVVDDRGGFRGFAMPEVDTHAATKLDNILQKKIRQHKGLPEFYGTRLLLAANLAALMAELHALGHYMVDMKPDNVMFYPDTWYMAILDTDGFSIGGRRRFPAHQFSDNYIAPEAKGLQAEQLGVEQDLFALAVIIFLLLNNGVHPYSGVSRRGQRLPTALQDRIAAGLYAYGLAPNKLAGPATASIHEYFEDETRRYFDRAFQHKGLRPSAIEWRDHLRSLLQNSVLVRCAVHPQDHAHFSKGCGLCALDKNAGSLIAAAARQRPTQASGAVLARLSTAPRTSSIPRARVSTGSAPYPVARSRWTSGRIALITVLAIAGVFFVVAMSGTNKNATTIAIAPTQPKPTTVPSMAVAPPPPKPAPPIPAPPVSRQAQMGGGWRGVYYYPDGRSPVSFIIFFDNACRGRSEEPNTMADWRVPKLYANWQCQDVTISSGLRVVISKRYDGTGGVSHSVVYSGYVSSDLNEITGEWSIGASRGKFTMRR
jgi:DNA-binding helix-hairpin-helix protein with protein kinase domain